MADKAFTVDFSLMLSMMLTLFLMLLIGYIARKAGLMDDKFSKQLSNLIICVGQPFMILNAVTNVEYSTENLKTAGIVLLLGLIIHGITAVVAHIASLPIKDKDEHAIFEYGLIFGNCGFMGFPILKSLLGDIGLFWGAFYVIAFNIIVWTYGMFVLSRARSEIKMSFKGMILNYGTTPCLIGLLLWVTQIKLPTPVIDTMSYMGSICTPISMLIVGALLAQIPLKNMFTNLKVYYSSFIRLLVNPLVVILIGKLVGADRFLGEAFLVFAAVMASVPTAANSAMFAERYDLLPVRAAHIVGISTALSAVTIPLMILVVSII
ncbi:MAG: AEC family transporter [Eubacteriales bacterium]|jgi:predicted permease